VPAGCPQRQSSSASEPMKLRYKILAGIVIVVAVGIVSLALAMSHTSPCGAAPPLPAGATLMKGIVHRCYGSPDVIRYEDLPRPAPGDDEVLVRVRAASINPLDWHYLEDTPYMVRMEAGFGKPENPRLGVDPSPPPVPSVSMPRRPTCRTCCSRQGSEGWWRRVEPTTQ
jgi:hypothetical protein